MLENRDFLKHRIVQLQIVYIKVYTIPLMERGEHGERNVVKAKVLLNIIEGHDTYDDIKKAMGYFYMRTSETSTIAPGLEIKEMGTSPKDIHYHLEHKQYGLVALKVVLKRGKKYSVRLRTVKDAERVIGVLSALKEFTEGSIELFNAFASVYYQYLDKPQVNVAAIVMNADKVKSGFYHIFAAFLMEDSNLKLFCRDYVFDIRSGYVAGKFRYYCYRSLFISASGEIDPKWEESVKLNDELYRKFEAGLPFEREFNEIKKGVSGLTTFNGGVLPLDYEVYKRQLEILFRH